jgi:arsenical pump membrane protein
VQALAAYSSVALTLGLVITRPRIGRSRRVNPGIAAACGVAIILLTGTIGFDDMRVAARELWRPFVTIASIMVMTYAASRLGVLTRLTARMIPHAHSTRRLFTYVFVLSALTSGVLNNDAAVLLLTPLVVLIVRAVFPEENPPILPFAFAVFMAAGVAPLVVANPMNMIVAEFADISFNVYAVRMAPISIVGWVIAYVVLRLIFRKDLDRATPDTREVDDTPAWQPDQVRMLVLLGAVLSAYPIVSYLDGPIWAVAATGAVVAIVLCTRTLHEPVSMLVRLSISWETLVFLFGVFLMAVGLQHAGIVDWLADVYSNSSVGEVGVASAAGSALINNHPMALINLLSLEGATDVGTDHILAALIGGDLGPRLLPMGSLAGLLWIAALRRDGIEISTGRFFVTGLAVTAPALAVSLLLLQL